MATYPLVGLQDEFGALVRLSLDRHGVPVTELFDVHEARSLERFVAIATPLVEDRGTTEAYKKVFAALRNETFTTKSFLDLHILILSTEKSQEIQRALRKGNTKASLEKLDFLNEVIVSTTADASNIVKSGLLHIAAAGNSAYNVVFAPDFGSGAAKSRPVSGLDELRKLMKALDASNPAEVDKLPKSRPLSVRITCSLDKLYKQGLI